MTEQEAKTKWCPFARVLNWTSDVVRQGDEPEIISGVVNREPGPYDADGKETVALSGRYLCLGSACMAWRDDRHPSWDQRYDKPPNGYCGLAGKP